MNRYRMSACFVAFSLLLFGNAAAVHGRGHADYEVRPPPPPRVVVLERFGEYEDDARAPLPDAAAIMANHDVEGLMSWLEELDRRVTELGRRLQEYGDEIHHDAMEFHDRLGELGRRVAEMDRRLLTYAYGDIVVVHPDTEEIQERLEDLDRRLAELDRRLLTYAYGDVMVVHPDTDEIHERLEALDLRVTDLDRRLQEYDMAAEARHDIEELQAWLEGLFSQAAEPGYRDHVPYTPHIPYVPYIPYTPFVQPPRPAPPVRPAVANPVTIGRIPAPDEYGLFRVQVTAQKTRDDAEHYRSRLVPVDSRVDIEPYESWHRVIIPGLEASEVRGVVRRLGDAGFGATRDYPIWIRRENGTAAWFVPVPLGPGRQAAADAGRPVDVIPRSYTPDIFGFYTIQVGAYTNIAVAQYSLDHLRSEGFASSRMERLDRSGGRYHHVFIPSVIGYEVEGLLRQLGNLGFEVAWVHREF